MDIDLGLGAAAFISSGAGWYAGHYFERKKAIAAFQRMQKSFIQSSMQSTTGMLRAAMTIFDKLSPGMTKEQSDAVVNQFITEANSHGLNLQIMTEEKAKQFGVQEFMNVNSDRQTK